MNNNNQNRHNIVMVVHGQVATLADFIGMLFCSIFLSEHLVISVVISEHLGHELRLRGCCCTEIDCSKELTV